MVLELYKSAANLFNGENKISIPSLARRDEYDRYQSNVIVSLFFGKFASITGLIIGWAFCKQKMQVKAVCVNKFFTKCFSFQRVERGLVEKRKKNFHQSDCIITWVEVQQCISNSSILG